MEQRRRHRHPWASMPDGPAAPSVFNATDRTMDQLSVHIWQGGDHRAGSQRRQSWTDQQIWLPGVSVSEVHRCRSLLLSFSICYLGILGLEGAINCILARTSHQRTTSEKRTKALLPKCPLFGGSTVRTNSPHQSNIKSPFIVRKHSPTPHMHTHLPNFSRSL